MINRFDKLKFKQLSQFIAVVEAGSITEAANNLCISQPALSRSIRDLENDLGGIRLFERAQKGVTLTSSGKKFNDFARIVYSNYEKSGVNIMNAEKESGGMVRIGMGAYEGYTFLPSIVERILDRRPNAQFTFISGRFEDMIGSLMSGNLDMIFGPVNANPLPHGAISRIVTHFQPSIVVRAQHPLANKKKLTLETLADQEWIVPVQNTLPRKKFEEVFLDQNLLPPSGAIEVGPSVMMIAILRQRDLIGLMHPQLHAFAANSAKLKLLNVEKNPFSWPVQLTTVDRRHPSLAVNETINLIKTLSDGL